MPWYDAVHDCKNYEKRFSTPMQYDRSNCNKKKLDVFKWEIAGRLLLIEASIRRINDGIKMIKVYNRWDVKMKGKLISYKRW